MTYTGVVTPRGVADVRELEHLTITKYAVDPEMANNCYLLATRPDEPTCSSTPPTAPRA